MWERVDYRELKLNPRWDVSRPVIRTDEIQTIYIKQDGLLKEKIYLFDVIPFSSISLDLCRYGKSGVLCSCIPKSSL